MATRRPVPGTPVLVRWRKWDGSPHWLHESVYLGSDAHGDWVGQRAGARSVRPGRDLRAGEPNVTLIPPAGTWAYTHNAAPASYAVYIDIGWDVRWDGDEPTGIDMDLDVVRTRAGRTFLDDEDEWAEHAEQYGYPDEVRGALPAIAADLLALVEDRRAPFDDETGRRWLAVLAGFADDRHGR